MSNQEYIRIYPTGLAPGKFYGTAKKHKVPFNETISDFSLSNIGTASYQLTKYLAKVLSPLSTSECAVGNNIIYQSRPKNEHTKRS